LKLTEDKKATIKSLEEYLKNLNKIFYLYGIFKSKNGKNLSIVENNNKNGKERINIYDEKYENKYKKRHEEKIQ